MNTKHTPGPWKIELTGYLPCIGIHAEHQPDGVVAMLTEIDSQSDGGSDENTRQANAHLIAAAPELLAALKLCADKLAMWPEGMNPEYFPSLKSARAAIDKAEGRA